MPKPDRHHRDDGDLDRAFWQTRSIGRSIGLNFTVAMEEGRLAPEDYAALIGTCRTCPHGEACNQWLAEAGGPNRASRPPSFCPNARALQVLKPH
jgi:hypothetical protein